MSFCITFQIEINLLILTPTAFKDAILLTDPKKVYRHESGNLSIQQTSE
jgi:hypothetical protein